MSKAIRLSLFLIAVVILQILFGSVMLSLAAASEIVDQADIIPPVGYIGQAQGGCTSAITVANANDSGAGSLRQALIDVCNDGTVDFAAGLINQTITLTSAELSITKTVTITNPNAMNLKVSGNNEHRVFNIQSGAMVTISSLSIISGTDSGFSCPYGCGGGIYIDSEAIVTLNYVTLGGHLASYGGGIFNNGSLAVNNSALNNNLSDNDGGGIYNTGILTVTNTVIDGNSSDYSGGGLLNYNITTLNDSFIINNSAPFGGGIRNENGHTVMINNSTFSGNSGSGIENFYSTLIISNSTFSGNTSGDGGGVANYEGRVTVSNSTFSGNIGGRNYGGGIDSTGIEAILNLRNNILANNSPTDCNDHGFGTIATNLNNLIEDGSCNINATGFVTGDPLLGPLANNGGSTFTHALLPGSPAIDAGDNATCLSTDQRGFGRPQDGDNDGTATCDIGAFEVPNPVIPLIQFTQAAYTVNEGIGTSQNIVLTRTGSLTGASQVQVSFTGGTATAGADYNSAGFPKTIIFNIGVVSQTVPITILNDILVEPTETINLSVSSLSNAVIGPQNNAVLQLTDDDTAAPSSLNIYLPLIIK